MSEKRFARTEMMLGAAAMDRLRQASVAIFGLGGVGGHAAEAMARSGVGKITLFDKDVVEITNVNRQLVAFEESLGRPKCEVMKERILSINPNAVVICHQVFYLPDNADDYPLTEYDYLIDAIDTVSAKIELVLRAKAAGVPLISAMGAGNKTDPTQLEVADIFQTSVCPLAKIMRTQLRKRGITQLKVVYSREKPLRLSNFSDQRTPASNAFVPAAMGLILAREAVFDLIDVESPQRKC